MVRNIYYLIAGMLSILFSFTHAINGNNSILRLVDLSNFDSLFKTTIFYLWHIITVENLIIGIIFIVMAFYKKQSEIKFTAWFIAIIIFARWVVIFGSTLLKNVNGVAEMLVDSIAIVVFITLIILGTRKKEMVTA